MILRKLHYTYSSKSKEYVAATTARYLVSREKNRPVLLLIIHKKSNPRLCASTAEKKVFVNKYRLNLYYRGISDVLSIVKQRAGGVDRRTTAPRGKDTEPL
jgi:hypothetical protein